MRKVTTHLTKEPYLLSTNYPSTTIYTSLSYETSITKIYKQHNYRKDRRRSHNLLLSLQQVY